MPRSKAWRPIYPRLLLYREQKNMQNNSIQVKGLQKSYQKLHVLNGVDFEVEKGSIFALLGSNGAGKTTIVKILTTLLKQDGGTATVNGFDVEAKPDGVRQSISLTGQTCDVLLAVSVLWVCCCRCQLCFTEVVLRRASWFVL